jgi:hypothetical protein
LVRMRMVKSRKYRKQWKFQ